MLTNILLSRLKVGYVQVVRGWSGGCEDHHAYQFRKIKLYTNSETYESWKNHRNDKDRVRYYVPTKGL